MTDYKERFEQLSDNQLLRLLENHSEVQEDALKVAILEANKRGFEKEVLTLVEEEKIQPKALDKQRNTTTKNFAFTKYIEVNSANMESVNFEVSLQNQDIPYHKSDIYSNIEVVQYFALGNQMVRYYFPAEVYTKAIDVYNKIASNSTPIFEDVTLFSEKLDNSTKEKSLYALSGKTELTAILALVVGSLLVMFFVLKILSLL